MHCCNKDSTGKTTTTTPQIAQPAEMKEIQHICPSKLSKRELEDLYFNLLQNNNDLKKTLNRQWEKIKVLSTKLQRMAATQKTEARREQRDCCSGTKAMVNEQKESILELRKANDRLIERIRQLNMRLCSAKQFLKRPSQVIARCPKCTCPRPCSGKSLVSTSALPLNSKQSDVNVKNKSASSQYLERDTNRDRPVKTPRSVDNGTECGNMGKDVGAVVRKSFGLEVENADLEEEKLVEFPESFCDENKCRTLMEELKQKIAVLQEELSKTHDEYSLRISRLEEEVLELRGENVRVRSDSAARAHELEQSQQQAKDATSRLRDAEGQCGDLAMKLSVEKSKVAELETQVKAANMSSQVSKTIEEHLSKQTSGVEATKAAAVPCECSSHTHPSAAGARVQPVLASTDLSPRTAPSQSAEMSYYRNQKNSDDSGYTDPNRSQDEDESLTKMNAELMLKIASLQAQLDVLKTTNTTAAPSSSVVKDDVRPAVEKPPDPMRISITPKDINKKKGELKPPSATQAVPVRTREKSLSTSSDSESEKYKVRNLSEANKRWEDYSTDNNAESADKTSGTVKKLTDLKEDKNKENQPKNDDDNNKYQIPGPIPVYQRDSIESSNSRRLSTVSAKKPLGDAIAQGRRERKLSRESIRSQKSLKSTRGTSSFEHRESLQIGYDKRTKDKKAENRRSSLESAKSQKTFLTDEADSIQVGFEPRDRVKSDLKLENRSIMNDYAKQVKKDIEKSYSIDKKLAIANTANNIKLGDLNSAELQTSTPRPSTSKSIEEEVKNVAIPSTSSPMLDYKETQGDIVTTDDMLATQVESEEFAKYLIPQPSKAIDLESQQSDRRVSLQPPTKANQTEEPPCRRESQQAEPKTEQTVSQLQIPPKTDQTNSQEPGRRVSHQISPADQTVQSQTEQPKSDRPRSLSLTSRKISPIDEPAQDKGTDSDKCSCEEQPPQVDRIIKTNPSKDQTRPVTKSYGDQVVQCLDQTNQADVEVEVRRNSATFTVPGTYTISGSAVVKVSRATSPENTDHEISSMTDLPSERDTYSSGRRDRETATMSPGEHKATTTYTDSTTMPTTEGLSEGQLDTDTARRKSIGEKSTGANTDTNLGMEASSSQKMEAALQAISDELARCRHLLLATQRSSEVTFLASLL